MTIVMATSIHLPQRLLDAVDRKARALRISRNQLMVRALEREISAGADWSTGFLDRLARPHPGAAEDVDRLLRAIRKARRSKSPRRL
jgi:hypothetical protein